ncbi:hypothetical protein DUNSADRAFT_14572 [Dunaliella salina]|uniref:Encoded protein n=1 Tax=Dunaliella salina TaxID=3046 RepID=A0ABQ7G781_DUNSA|nr:hypothetical protein DUNSADRAFT_14572 [Dunaliella salina]|eukprot:KAF5830434.1 hypothetical protein DUNSADRAFT_14572 [Dunaliella salina]
MMQPFPGAHHQCLKSTTAGSAPTRMVAQVPRMRRVVARAEPFNESAAQVKRLVQRDRKEFLGNNVDILDQYTTEFGDVEPRKDGQQRQQPNPGAKVPQRPSPSPVAAAAAPAAVPASTSQPATSPAPQPSTSKPSSPASKPFKSSGSDNPFGSSDNPFGPPTAISPFGNSGKTKSRIEPEGLSPDMGPDAIVKETPFDILKDITLTQVVLFFSFTLIIGLMIATFYIVLQSGAIRLNGV